MSAAAGPCEVDGCDYGPGKPSPRYPTTYVYEHCHKHDYIRGIACGMCNGLRIVLLDARVDVTGNPRFAAYLAWWHRCPQCAAEGWEPYLTQTEYEWRQQIKAIISLADELSGRIPPRPVRPNVVPLAEQLHDFDRHLARRYPALLSPLC